MGTLRQKNNNTNTCESETGLAVDRRDTPFKVTLHLAYRFLFCFLGEAR